METQCIRSPDFLKVVENVQSIRPLTFMKVLNESPRSLVISCFNSDHKQEVVLKISRSMKYWQREVTCLSSLNHPNFVKILDSFQCGEFCCIILEKIQGYCLVDLLMESERISEKHASFFTKQLIDGLIYLHSLGWVHRDLKPDNLIFDQRSNLLRIIDFEFSCTFSKWKRHHSNVGTLLYSSPEVRKKKYRGPEAEVWSLGITVYVLVTGCFPFNEDELENFDDEFIIPEELSDECIDFLKRTLNKDVKQRAKLEDLKSHKWLSNFRNERKETDSRKSSPL